MKKLLISVYLFATLTIHAATWQYESFLFGNKVSQGDFGNSTYTGLYVTNGGTYTNGETNTLIYTVANGLPNTFTIATPLIAYSTNYINGLTNSVIGAPTGFTNVTGVGALVSLYNPYAYMQYGTNAFYIANTTGQTTSAGNVTGSGWYDVRNSADANGCINSNGTFIIAQVGDFSGFTNTTVYTFWRSGDMKTWDTANTFAVTLTGNGTTPVVVMTNAPISFLQGARAFRIGSIVNSTNAAGGGKSTNSFVYSLGYGSWQP